MTGFPELANAGGVDGSRFAAVSQIPTYAAALYVALLVTAGAPAEHVDFTKAVHRLDQLSATTALVLGLAILLVALVLHPLQLPLVRLLEGYWPGHFGRTLAAVRVRQLERKRVGQPETLPDRKPDPETDQAVLAKAWLDAQRYPPGNVPLLPTALGNALRAAEATAGAAYGAEAVTWWPRLYNVLAVDVRSVVDDRRLQLDVACRLTATAAAAGVATLPLLARSGWWLVVAIVPFALAWTAYQAAVAAAVAYGEAVRAAFDLHRFDLLKALHVPLPANVDAERDLNRRLSRFWDQGVPLPLDFAYAHGKDEA